MARTPQLFVDDVVQGNLPMVCVVSGKKADGLLTIEVTPARWSGYTWLLVFAGPFGILAWLALEVLTSDMTLRLPMTRSVVDRHLRARVRIWFAGFSLVAAALVGFLLLRTTAESHYLLRSALTVVVAAALLAAVGWFLACVWTISATGVKVRLDSSRRWLTIVDVSPNFAAACESYGRRAAAR